MASILVYIEIDGEHPSRASMEALGEGRRIATALGAALHAFVPLPGAPDVTGDREDTWVRLLGRAGADKVVMMPLAAAAGPALWVSHGLALCAVCERLRPALVLMAATATGRDMAARLSARLSATLLGEVTIEHEAKGPVAQAPEGARVRAVPVAELGGCAVITLVPGSSQPARGYDEAEAMCLDLPDPEPQGTVEYLGSDPDPGAALERARVVVVAGDGVRTAETYALLGELARALGGELGATPALCAQGIAPPERAIGAGLRHVAPELYVVCAASGSLAHLRAVSPHAAIVAIDSDPEAPIFQRARYGIVGEIDTVVPALLAALAERRAQPRTATTT